MRTLVVQQPRACYIGPMDQQVTNLAKLTGLFRGDRKRVVEWVVIYLAEVPPLFAALQAHVSSGDTKALSGVAHELKPQAHYLGAPLLQERLRMLEERAVDQGASSCAGPVAELQAMEERIEEELQAFLKQT